jgi:hypothetical protein
VSMSCLRFSGVSRLAAERLVAPVRATGDFFFWVDIDWLLPGRSQAPG